MKKQYILIALALIGVGIVTTMAFEFTDGVNVQSEVYSITDTASSGAISKVRATPYGGIDIVRIKITMTASANVDFSFDTGVDLTGCTIDTTVGSVNVDDIDIGHFEVTGVTSGTTSLVITIDGTSASALVEDTLWEELSDLIIGIADA